MLIGWQNLIRKRIERTKQIISEAEKEIRSLAKNSLFLPGFMLYWAEGDKSGSNEVVKFTNSDSVMVKLKKNQLYNGTCAIKVNSVFL